MYSSTARYMIFPDYKYDRLGVGERLDFGIKLAVLKQVIFKSIGVEM